jgi:RimJ/RimL family protein N-acetyltransferase
MRTDRLTLRQWDPDDEADVRAAFDIYRRVAVVEWLGRPAKPWASEGATREILRRWVGISVERPGFGLWAMVPDAVGRPVGTLLLVPLPGPGGALTADIEIGWHLHPDHWGKGYATEAARGVLDHAFDDLELPVVNAVAYKGNDASFSVMRRLGMTYRGTTDRWYDTSFEHWAVERTTASSPH